MNAIAAIFSFLLEHADLVAEIMDVISGGARKEDVIKAVRSAAVAASDAEMHRELDP